MSDLEPVLFAPSWPAVIDGPVTTLTETCPECDGAGRHYECEHGRADECEAGFAHGSRLVDCEPCGGSGVVPRTILVAEPAWRGWVDGPAAGWSVWTSTELTADGRNFTRVEQGWTIRQSVRPQPVPVVDGPEYLGMKFVTAAHAAVDVASGRTVIVRAAGVCYLVEDGMAKLLGPWAKDLRPGQVVLGVLGETLEPLPDGQVITEMACHGCGGDGYQNDDTDRSYRCGRCRGSRAVPLAGPVGTLVEMEVVR